MKRGDLLKIKWPGDKMSYFLYSRPGVFRSDITGKMEIGQLCLVLETMEYLGLHDFFVRIVCPSGTGWINSTYLVVVRSFDDELEIC